jgi:glycerol uptake facilitator-like aquaporin
MKLLTAQGQGSCFLESDPGLALARRAIAEGVGSFLLMFAISGSGILAQRLSDDHLLGIFVSAIATAGALAGLIIAFGPVSGGHFNPLISGLQWLWGQRTLDCALVYIAAQIIGTVGGAFIADFILEAGRPENLPFVSGHSIASEIISSAGLMIVVFGSSRGGKTDVGPFAVGAWLTAAIVATPSGSYANPAVALAAVFSGGQAGLSVQTALAYLPAQITGAILAFVVVTISFPVHRVDVLCRRIFHEDAARSVSSYTDAASKKINED